ncbi:hypothetical protein DFR58_14311 [Anaerobacterium chartisolvens]|uniref:Uncharacterized protein n=1 Tax=Anaerobacterium chartisolvens TaxID=1297424 RepID=A0A369AG34_9FIRM|nr:hypothetical protein DFR58_14311 [Anaerobacterium chartisolvens]
MKNVKILNASALNLNVQKASKAMPCDVTVYARWTYRF